MSNQIHRRLGFAGRKAKNSIKFETLSLDQFLTESSKIVSFDQNSKLPKDDQENVMNLASNQKVETFRISSLYNLAIDGLFDPAQVIERTNHSVPIVNKQDDDDLFNNEQVIKFPEANTKKGVDG